MVLDRAAAENRVAKGTSSQLQYNASLPAPHSYLHAEIGVGGGGGLGTAEPRRVTQFQLWDHVDGILIHLWSPLMF